MSYSERQPGPELEPFIECAWVMYNEGLRTYIVPPDGCVDIVYSPEMGLRAIGAMTVRQEFHLAPAARVAGIRFRPGMARLLLGPPADGLTDLAVPLEDLWGKRARELLNALREAESGDRWANGLARAIAPDCRTLTPVARALGHIASCHGEVDLDRIAAESNLSPRQFRRRCLAESGLTPKLLCRILRFRYALQLSRTRLRWPEIAADAGYFDQAHLIRDFRAFLGRPPMSVSSNTGLPPRRNLFTVEI